MISCPVGENVTWMDSKAYELKVGRVDLLLLVLSLKATMTAVLEIVLAIFFFLQNHMSTYSVFS